MTTAEMMKEIGKVYAVQVAEGFTVQVEIVDMKMSYGTVRAKVGPLAGCGSAWVNFDRLRDKDWYPVGY